MNPAVTAIVAENTVLLAAITAAWHLLRQGGGLQLKTPPVPKKTAEPAAAAQDGPVRDITRRAS